MKKNQVKLNHLNSFRLIFDSGCIFALRSSKQNDLDLSLLDFVMFSGS